MSVPDPAPTTDTDRPATTEVPAAPWWRQAVVYQVYPRSFADSGGDGLGDLPGVTSRADYLHALGVDAVWLSPFYPSPLEDGGYDVSNYRDVDPRLGTLADFDEMVAALHERGIKVVVDIVPNHTSSEHEWFVAALAAGRGSPERDRYIFRDGSGPDGDQPPSDWQSLFGGPAWERVDDGQWYLHNFATGQPDLNWSNREVRDDFLTTLRFWSDRGADGFRVDVAHYLTKDLGDELPTQSDLDATPIDGFHPMVDRDDVHDVYAEWRAVFDEYDPPRTAVAEAWVSPTRVPLYASPTSLGQAFNFDLLEADFDAEQFRAAVTHNVDLAAQSGSSSTWVLSNHDVVRHATRYGLPHPERDAAGRPLLKHGTEWLLSGGRLPLDRDAGLRRARAATLFLLGLPGSGYLYQGEELGLHEVAEISDAERQDPTFFRNPGRDVGRDGCRVPLPWSEDGPSFGFGDGAPHLPQPDWMSQSAVSLQEGVDTSTLTLYRRALQLRRELLRGEEFAWRDTDRADVLRFARHDGWEVVTVFGDEPYTLPDSDGVMIASGPIDGRTLPGATTAWVAPA